MPAPTFATHTLLAVKNFTAKMGRYWKNSFWRVIWHFQTPDFSLVLEPRGIDHSESSRNNQSELIRNSQCTCLAN